jgi:hypothetical protein
VPFGHETGCILQRYRVLRRPQPAAPSVDCLLLEPGRPRMTDSLLEMVFRRARTRTGVTRLHPTCCVTPVGSRSSEMGIPMLTFQRFMLHSQPNVTERYSHLATSEARTHQ